MNWKGCGRKWSWLNLSHSPGICLEGMKKATENLNKDTGIQVEILIWEQE
jgi:hypothetical protein